MTSPALLALSVLFLADDPTLPAVVVEVKETPARQLTVYVVDDDTPGTSMQLQERAGDAPLVAGRWPLLPRGASLTPAVDGVILTIDDAGAWTAGFTSTTAAPRNKGTAKKPKTPTHPWPPPSLPIEGTSTLRLFLPTVVDGTGGTLTSASLHGRGFAVPGTALVSTAPLTPALITLAGADVDVSAPTIVATAKPDGACAAVPTVLLQPTTQLQASLPECAAGFAVSVVRGQRYADTKAGDLPARGVLVMSMGPSTTKP